MKLSRDWLGDYLDLTDLSDDELARRFTEIGHAVEAVESHADDTVFDLEITANRVDAMSHYGMARDLAAALGREIRQRPVTPATSTSGSMDIRIEAPEMCTRFTGLVIRNVNSKPSPEVVRRRLEAVGLRSISNIVDVTNYVMLALGHPMHAYDLDKLSAKEIIVRRGRDGESMKTLDGETRAIDANTVVIAEGPRATGLGGIMGGGASEIGGTTKNVLLECAHFVPSVIRRTARRLGMKTDASYRFERGVDPNDGPAVIHYAGELLVELAGGTREEIIDVVAVPIAPKTVTLRASKIAEASGGAVSIAYALELFRRLGFEAAHVEDGLRVIVPTYRADINEEIDLVEEVLRFFGLNNVPSMLPRVTTGDVRQEPVEILETELRDLLVGCGLTEVVTYSFIKPEWNPQDEQPVLVTNALTENLAAMRLSMLPGLLETVVFNRSYGTRDGALFEVGRTYHRAGNSVREHHRLGIVLFGTIGTFWGDGKRPVDFFDAKGIVEQVAGRVHVPLTFAVSDDERFQRGKRAVAWHGDRRIADLGFLSDAMLQQFGIKGEVLAAEIDVAALLELRNPEWKMAPVSRFPGVPMVLGVTHGRELEYQRLAETIRSLNVPHLQQVGLRDRFVPEGEENVVKTTLGMWYQAFDRSLTQEEVAQWHQQLAARVAELLPVKVLS